MWKGGYGDVEMVGSSASNSDASTTEEFDDEFEEQGYDMAGRPYHRRSAKKAHGNQVKGCLVVLILLVAVLLLSLVYSPGFATTTAVNEEENSANDQQPNDNYNGDDNDDDDDDSTPSELPSGTVPESSIIHHEAYVVTLQIPIDTIQGHLVLYQHKKTQTPVMTILPYDTQQDSVFVISYRTKPSNSHGAPHVLEHAVLAGSKKYPIKDPFTQVMKGSLNTFVNAMTYDDLTAYLCASRNDADMNNLMSVYMDAVFQPLVVQESGNLIFRQEGWRVEMNETGEPQFNGVVLSEMKGAMSSPNDILVEYSKAQLFPNTTYRFNSGGEPKVIPELTHEELRDFYQTFYHPSNAQVFLYGSKTSAQNCLNQLDEYLSAYEARLDIRNSSTIDLQPLLDLPTEIQRLAFASDDQDDSHSIMMSWLISHDGIMDDEFQRHNRLAYAVLSELLLSDQYGVLYQVLQDSGLTGSIQGNIEQGLLQWTLDIMLNNVNATNVEAVVNLVRDTLVTIVQDGFHAEDIESAMNTVEFNNRDMSSAGYPRGIPLWMRLMETWKYDLDPLTGFLSFEDDLQALQHRVNRDGSDVFVSILKDNVINNQHSIVIDLYPDPTLAQKNQQEEESRLVKLRKSQSFPGLLDESDHMTEWQVADDPPELLALIPTVVVDDLAKQGYEPPIVIDEDKDGSGVTVLVHEVVSSFGIVYVDFGVDVSMLDFDDIVLIPVLAKLMLEGGTEKYDETQIGREIGKATGGISEEFLIQPILPINATTEFLLPDGDHFHSRLFFHGAAMKHKCDKLLELVSQILFHPVLDSPIRAMAILRERISLFEQSLSTGSTRLVSKRLFARYGAFQFIEEEAEGISAVSKLREFLSMAESDWSTFLARLQKMKDAIVNQGSRKGMILNLTGEKSVLEMVDPVVSQFLANHLPTRSEEDEETFFMDFATTRHPWALEAKKRMAMDSPIRNEGIVMTTNVNFVGSGGPFYKPLESVSGSTAVVTQFIEFNNFMLEIRQRRGAYGAWASLDKWTGILLYMSFRDPNLSETVQVYSRVVDYLKEELQHEETALPLIHSAIIGTIGTLDGSAPQPSTIGWMSLLQYISGSSAQIRQAWRDEILFTNLQDVLEYAQRLESSWWEPTLSIGGPKSILEKEETAWNMTLINVLS